MELAAATADGLAGPPGSSAMRTSAARGGARNSTTSGRRRRQLGRTSPSVPRPVSLSWQHGALGILHANCSTAPHWAAGSMHGTAEHWPAPRCHIAPTLPLAERRALRARYRCQGRIPHSHFCKILLLFKISTMTDAGMQQHECAYVSVLEEYNGPRKAGHIVYVYVY